MGGGRPRAWREPLTIADASHPRSSYIKDGGRRPPTPSPRKCGAREKRSTARQPTPRLHLEEHRLVVALQADIETIDRVAGPRLARRDQRGAALDRHQRQHGIGSVGRIAVALEPRL